MLKFMSHGLRLGLERGSRLVRGEVEGNRDGGGEAYSKKRKIYGQSVRG